MMRNGSAWRRSAGLALLTLALAGCSDVEVRGVVRDRQTLEPLHGATVVIGEEVTTTDDQGVYTMDVDSTDEPVRVHVSAANHLAQTDLRPVRDDPDPTFLSFDLEPTPPTAAEEKAAQEKADRQAAQGGKVDVKIDTRSGSDSDAEGGSVPAGTPRDAKKGEKADDTGEEEKGEPR